MIFMFFCCYCRYRYSNAHRIKNKARTHSLEVDTTHRLYNRNSMILSVAFYSRFMHPLTNRCSLDAHGEGFLFRAHVVLGMLCRDRPFLHQRRSRHTSTRWFIFEPYGGGCNPHPRLRETIRDLLHSLQWSGIYRIPPPLPSLVGSNGIFDPWRDGDIDQLRNRRLLGHVLRNSKVRSSRIVVWSSGCSL